MLIILILSLKMLKLLINEVIGFGYFFNVVEFL